MGFAVTFHHMGMFERNKGLKYVGGEIHVVKGIDPDFWSYFKALSILKEFKYARDVKLWWKGSKQKLLNNLRLLSDDKEALALAKYVEDKNEEVDIYVQHVPCQPEVVHFIVGAGMDEELGQAEMGVEAQKGCEPEVGVHGDVVGQAEHGCVVEKGCEAEQGCEAKQGCEAQMGTEAQLGVEVEVGVQGDVVGEAELGVRQK